MNVLYRTLVLGLLSVLLFLPSGAWGQTNGLFNVRDFGAVGDGTTKDTAAIQKALDACTQAGGGTVLLPAGTYLTGSIYLKSNTELKIGAGAVLLASPDKEDYNAEDVCPQNEAFHEESTSGAHLLLCIEQENVTLSGPGVIDGNSPAFLLDKDGKYYQPRNLIPWRPSQMVYFVECQNVRVRDLEMRRAPYWTCFLHGCTNVMIHGVKISTERSPHTYNGDGIDIDCCRFVTVSDCNIDTADDCLTLRAWDRRLKHPQPTEYVTVTNCVLSTSCNAIRVGVGTGKVRHAVFSNIVIRDTTIALNLISAWTPCRGVDIEDVRFLNFDVTCRKFLYLAYHETHQAQIRNLFFSGIHGTVDRFPALILGNTDRNIENVQLQDWDLVSRIPGPFLEISHVKDLNLRNLRIRHEDPTAATEPAKPAEATNATEQSATPAPESAVSTPPKPEIFLGEVQQLRSSDCEPAVYQMTPPELEAFHKRAFGRW